MQGLRAALLKPLKWALAVGVFTAIATIFMPNYYRSDARLLPVEAKAQGGAGQLAAAAAAFGLSAPGTESDANLVAILQSRWMREQLIQSRFRFHDRAWRFGTERVEDCTLYDYLDQKNMDQAVKKLSEVLRVDRDLKTKLITISAETRSPELSQEVVQRAQALLSEFLQDKEQTRGSAKATFAQERLADAKRERSQAEDAFRTFLEVNRNYQTSTDPTVRLRGGHLEADLRLREQLVNSLAVARDQALLESKDDVPILNVLDAGNLPIEKSRPARSIIVLGVMAAVWALMFAWGHRSSIKAFLSTE